MLLIFHLAANRCPNTEDVESIIARAHRFEFSHELVTEVGEGLDAERIEVESRPSSGSCLPLGGW